MKIASPGFADDFRSAETSTAKFSTERIIVDPDILNLILWRDAAARESIDHECSIGASLAARSRNLLEIRNEIVYFVRQGNSFSSTVVFKLESASMLT